MEMRVKDAASGHPDFTVRSAVLQAPSQQSAASIPVSSPGTTGLQEPQPVQAGSRREARVLVRHSPALSASPRVHCIPPCIEAWPGSVGRASSLCSQKTLWPLNMVPARCSDGGLGIGRGALRPR